MLAFALLVWASVTGIILGAAAKIHSFSVSSGADTLAFFDLYRAGYLVFEVLWGIALLQLIQWVCTTIEQNAPASAAAAPTVRIAPVLRLKRFSTAPRLWFVVSLVLFTPPWFTTDLGKGGSDSVRYPYQLWTLLFSRASTSPHEILSRIFFFAVGFSVPALAIGWVVQGVIVMIRDAARGSRPDAV